MEIKIRQGVASDAAQTTPLILNAAQSLLTSIFGQNKNKKIYNLYLKWEKHYLKKSGIDTWLRL